MSEEKSKEAKTKEFMYKAVDKVGHFFRKVLPYAAAFAVGAIVKAVTGKDDGNSSST